MIGTSIFQTDALLGAVAHPVAAARRPAVERRLVFGLNTPDGVVALPVAAARRPAARKQPAGAAGPALVELVEEQAQQFLLPPQQAGLVLHELPEG